MKTRVFVVEDHQTVRQGIVETINREPDLTVCGEADELSPAIDAIMATHPDLVLIDIYLKSSSGLDLIRRLRPILPALPLIGMTMFDGVRYESQARDAGANRFVLKQEGPETLISAIRDALRNDSRTDQPRRKNDF